MGNAPQNGYILNPSLELINKDFQGNLIENGRFSSMEQGNVYSAEKKLFDLLFTRNTQKQEKHNENYKLEVIPNETFWLDKNDKIVWLGHATFFIRIDGVNFITDPILTKNLFLKRLTNYACDVRNIKNIDYFLISHGHMDHFDTSTLNILMQNNPNAIGLLPLSMGRIQNPINKLAKCQEAGWWQKYKINQDISVILLPAKHWYKRTLLDFNKVLWGSQLIKGKNKTIYFGGDTSYYTHFRDIQKIIGNIDVCLLGIGAYKPEFIMKDSHMNPREAVNAFNDLKGKVMIPMHYGTFDLAQEPVGEPIKWLRELNKQGQINGKLEEMIVGKEQVLENDEKQHEMANDQLEELQNKNKNEQMTIQGNEIHEEKNDILNQKTTGISLQVENFSSYPQNAEFEWKNEEKI